MTTTKRLAAGASGLALLAGTFMGGTALAAAPAQSQAGGPSPAASCYGSATSKTFNMGTDEAPHSFGPYYTANPKVCGDINLKLTKWGSADRLYVHVCFHPTSGKSWCTKDKTFTKKNSLNKWRVLATDVVPGTKYRIGMDFGSHTFKGKLAD